jgi:hypothetical protein
MWISLVCLIVGAALGYAWREIHELQRHVIELSARVQPRATPGVTMGIYNPANENKQTPHVVVPKTPQLIEFESMERTKQENLVTRNIRPQ